MYIPEFVCGFIAGAFVGVLLVVIFSLMVAAKDEPTEPLEPTR